MASESFVALVPARGGSKSISRKNIRPLAGKPLLYWVLEAAAGCAALEHIYVATDDGEIAGVVEGFGEPRVQAVSRSPATATDTASTESVMHEFAQAYAFEHLVLIQATSPLLEAQHLSEGIAQYLETGVESLLSVVRQKRFLWENVGGVARPLNYDPAQRPRRQDFEGYLVENGAFYITNRARLLAGRARLGGRIGAYEMPEESYYELDEPSDWRVLEALLNTRRLQTPVDLRHIRLLLCDVDGVLTDAGMYYSETGDETKKFNTRDGKGLERLRLAGIRTGFITGERTALLERRARKLRVDYLFQGALDKVAVFEGLLAETGLAPHEVAYIGDDVNDLELLQRVGFAAAPADALPEVQARVHYLCRASGGGGCVRELAELILAKRSP